MRRSVMLLDRIDAKYNDDYKRGRAIYAKGLSVESCQYVVDKCRSAWIVAGWHDADIEAGNSVLKGATK